MRTNCRRFQCSLKKKLLAFAILVAFIFPSFTPALVSASSAPTSPVPKIRAAPDAVNATVERFKKTGETCLLSYAPDPDFKYIAVYTMGSTITGSLIINPDGSLVKPSTISQDIYLVPAVLHFKYGNEINVLSNGQKSWANSAYWNEKKTAFGTDKQKLEYDIEQHSIDLLLEMALCVVTMPAWGPAKIIGEIADGLGYAAAWAKVSLATDILNLAKKAYKDVASGWLLDMINPVDRARVMDILSTIVPMLQRQIDLSGQLFNAWSQVSFSSSSCSVAAARNISHLDFEIIDLEMQKLDKQTDAMEAADELSVNSKITAPSGAGYQRWEPLRIKEVRDGSRAAAETTFLATLKQKREELRKGVIVPLIERNRYIELKLYALPSQVKADGQSICSVQAYVLGGYISPTSGPTPVPGVTVSFATTRGNLTTATANTDEGGCAAVTLTSSSAGTATITATIPSYGMTDSASVDFFSYIPPTGDKSSPTNPYTLSYHSMDRYVMPTWLTETVSEAVSPGGDVDVYRIDIPTGKDVYAQLSVWLTAPTDTSLNPYLVLSSTENPAVSEEPVITTRDGWAPELLDGKKYRSLLLGWAQPGRYYLFVKGLDNTQGTYSLWAQFWHDKSDFFGEKREWAESLQSGLTLYQTIWSDNDVDWLKMSVGEAGRLAVKLVVPLGLWCGVVWSFTGRRRQVILTILMPMAGWAKPAPAEKLQFPPAIILSGFTVSITLIHRIKSTN